MHVHIGPEIIPRKYTTDKLIRDEKGKIGGFVLKNHFYPTQPFINEISNSKGLKFFGGVVLNNSVGGLNSEAILASRLITDKPFTVWFPTINAKNFLSQNKYEIPPEWVNNKQFVGRRADSIIPVTTTKNNKLTKEAIGVLKQVKQSGAILATGHLSWRESVLLTNNAIELGVKNIIITHPIYQTINMPVTVQKYLAKKGCFIEQSYSMYSIDNIPISRIAKQIKEIGYKSVILSSDVGQRLSPPPSRALYDFAIFLKREGISEEALFYMLVTNPKKLLKIN